MDYIKHLETSVENSFKKISKLTNSFLEIHDKDSRMTSHKVRMLLNNLCDFKGCNYLEIGSWRGSSFQSAIFENNITATCIDWWRNFGCNGKISRDIFFRNLYKTLELEKNSTYKELKIIDNDAFDVNINELKKDVNVYFYDGDHSEESQYKGFMYFDFILSQEFFVVIDDWNDNYVRSGTRKAFDELNYIILQQYELPGVFSDWKNDDLYWNGLYVAVVNKT